MKLLAVRGALNLFYLLGAQDKKAQADALAAAVSAGYAPVQFILSFFILTLWALGEAVLDVRGAFFRREDGILENGSGVEDGIGFPAFACVFGCGSRRK